MAARAPLLSKPSVKPSDDLHEKEGFTWKYRQEGFTWQIMKNYGLRNWKMMNWQNVTEKINVTENLWTDKTENLRKFTSNNLRPTEDKQPLKHLKAKEEIKQVQPLIRKFQPLINI